MRPFNFPITFQWSGDFEVRDLLAPADAETLARLLDWNGWPYPIVVDRGAVVVGERRLQAASLLEDHMVPVVQLKDLKQKDLACFEAADARLAERGSWGAELLSADRDMLERMAERRPAPPPAVTQSAVGAQRPKLAVTKFGDRWLLGRHELHCNDARSLPSALLAHYEGADAVFFDPPQNTFNQRTEQTYAKGLAKLAVTARMAMRPGSLMFASFDWRNLARWLRICPTLGLEPRDLCVWDGASAPAGALYQGSHKLISCARFTGVHINNVALNDGPAQTNVFRMPSDPGAPTSLPVALTAQLIEDATPQDGRVVDLCARLGSTLISAERTGRRSFNVELSPQRCDAIIENWQLETGCIATRAADEVPYAACAAARTNHEKG